MKVLVVGSGIAGIVASVEAAEKGHEVVLVEKKHFAGGMLPRLDIQFPTDACGACQIYPFTGEFPDYCLKRLFHHPDVKVITGGEIEEIEGEGPFNVRIKIIPRGVNEDCTACRKCEEVCPVPGAIYMEYPRPHPVRFAIDWDKCTRCGKCVEVCPENAIDLDEKEKTEEIEVDAIIYTTGFEEIDPETLKEYGYGKYPDIVTSIEFEEMLSGMGEFKRPSDGRVPEKIAFIQCVGSRDVRRNPDCSCVCCMFTLKEIHLLKKHYPQTQAKVFYMDMRTYGKGYYRYFLNTDAEFIPVRTPGICEREGKLILRYEKEGKFHEEEFDLVVLAVGEKRTFEHETHPFIPVKAQEGIWVAGSASGPKDLADTVVSSLAATSFLPAKPKEIEEKKEGNTGVVVCTCSGVIPWGFENLNPGVPWIKVEHLCRRDREKVKAWIEENEIKRLVLAGCTPYVLYRIARELRVSGIFVNIREGILWRGGTEENAREEIERAVRRVLGKEEKEVWFEPVRKVLVIGGGIGGLVAAKNIAEHGIPVVLVEKEKLGGRGWKVKRLLTGEEVEPWLSSLIEEVKEKVDVREGVEVKGVKGALGNFRVEFSDGSEDTFGAVVVATGAKDYTPEEYGYGKDPKVITQTEFEEKLEKEKPGTVVMIQCVGSRNEKRPYCSRVCCSQAVKNALRLKEISPSSRVFILYRDMMMYGKKERYYTEAREKGVIFIRYEEEPQWDGERVVVKDLILGEEIEIKPDYLVLSAGMVPENSLAEILGIELTEDGWYKEMNPKFKPLEARPGIFLAGNAQGPGDIPETVTKALGVASSVVRILSGPVKAKGRISITKERICAGCGICVDVCPYGARYLLEERKIAGVHYHICQGCGTCVSACPSGACELTEMGSKVMMEVLR